MPETQFGWIKLEITFEFTEYSPAVGLPDYPTQRILFQGEEYYIGDTPQQVGYLGEKGRWENVPLQGDIFRTEAYYTGFYHFKAVDVVFDTQYPGDETSSFTFFDDYWQREVVFEYKSVRWFGAHVLRDDPDPPDPPVDPPSGSLFTGVADAINLNSLTSDQQKRVEDGADSFNALGGDDTVTLPDAASWIVARGHYSYAGSKIFDGGAGSDRVTGGSLNDRIYGGNTNERDTLNGGIGNDRLIGGLGNDTINGGEGTKNTAVFSGSGSAYTAFLESPISWVVKGPAGTDQVILVQDFEFGNRAVDVDKLFRQLVTREQAKAMNEELHRLLRKDEAMTGAIAACDQLIANAKEQISTANLGLKLAALQTVADKIVGFIMKTVPEIGGAVYIAWRTGNIIGSVGSYVAYDPSPKSARENREFYGNLLVKEFAELADTLFGDSRFVKIGTAPWRLDDYVEFGKEWLYAVKVLEDARDQLKAFRSQQYDLSAKIKALETELRDKEADENGLPSVRLKGESAATPDLSGRLDGTLPDAIASKFASYAPATKTVTSFVTFSLSASQQNVTLVGAADSDATGNNLANRLIGNSGDNILYARGGDDIVAGKDGSDTIVAGSGAGNDRYDGGAGIDTVTFASTTKGVTVNLATGKASGVGIGRDTLARIENVLGGSGPDVIIGNGSTNRLAGSFGNDQLTGGAGRDTFVFDAALNGKTNLDTVKDFSVAADTIELDNSIFTALKSTGVLNVKWFHVGAKAADLDDHIIYNSTNGALIYDADGSKPGGAVEIAILPAKLPLSFGDFLVT